MWGLVVNLEGVFVIEEIDVEKLYHARSVLQ